jgi:hypothetical protein
LICARFFASSRAYFRDVIRDLARKGCDAVAVPWTEIPLLVGEALQNFRFWTRPASSLGLPARGSIVKFAQIDGSPAHDRLAYTAWRGDDLFDSILCTCN